MQTGIRNSHVLFCNKSYQSNNFEISRANIGGGTHLFQEANASNGNSQKHRSILWDSYILLYGPLHVYHPEIDTEIFVFYDEMTLKPSQNISCG